MAPVKTKKKITNSALVGCRPDLDPPGPGIDVLVDLTDSDPPQQGTHQHRDARRELVRGGAAEGVLDEARGGAGQLQVRDQICDEGVRVAPRGVEEGDGHECGRQDRQRRVNGHRAARVAAGREVGPEPLQREPAHAGIGAAAEPILHRPDATACSGWNLIRFWPCAAGIQPSAAPSSLSVSLPAVAWVQLRR